MNLQPKLRNKASEAKNVTRTREQLWTWTRQAKAVHFLANSNPTPGSYKVLLDLAGFLGLLESAERDETCWASLPGRDFPGVSAVREGSQWKGFWTLTI